MTIGTPVKDVLMGMLHEERCADVESDQDDDCKLLLNVLHLPSKCRHRLREMQEFSFIAFLSNLPYLWKKGKT